MKRQFHTTCVSTSISRVAVFIVMAMSLSAQNAVQSLVLRSTALQSTALSGLAAMAMPTAGMSRSSSNSSVGSGVSAGIQAAESQGILNPASARVVSDSVYSHLEWKFNNRDKVVLLLTLTEDQSVDISIYNILGKKIKELDHSFMTECTKKELSYSLSDVPMGAYIIAGQGSSFRSAVRIIVSDKDY